MIRSISLILVSAIPLGILRRFLYRSLFGFKIASTARIGMFNYLDIRELDMMDHAVIRGFGNVFMSFHRLEMLPYSRIGAPRVGMNLFRGTTNKEGYPSAVMRLGHCSIIELFHYFDICGDLIIGDNVVIGGIRSVFFTHTLYEAEFEAITIGDNVYVGSNSLFQMGASVPANSVVGLGSVVVGKIDGEGSMIGGVPAKVVKEDGGYSAETAMKLRSKPFYKDGEYILP